MSNETSRWDNIDYDEVESTNWRYVFAAIVFAILSLVTAAFEQTVMAGVGVTDTLLYRGFVTISSLVLSLFAGDTIDYARVAINQVESDTERSDNKETSDP